MQRPDGAGYVRASDKVAKFKGAIQRVYDARGSRMRAHARGCKLSFPRRFTFSILHSGSVKKNEFWREWRKVLRSEFILRNAINTMVPL